VRPLAKDADDDVRHAELISAAQWTISCVSVFNGTQIARSPYTRKTTSESLVVSRK